MGLYLLFVTVDLATILPPILVAAVVGLAVWKYKVYATGKETQRLKDIADLAKEKEASALERAKILEDEKLRIEAKHQAVLTRLTALEEKGDASSATLELLKHETLPMIEATKRKLVELLTHPGDEFLIPDALLQKVVRIGEPLTADEKSSVALLMSERVRSASPHVSQIEKVAAAALMPIIELAEIEAEHASSAVITAVQLVTSTVKSPATKKKEEE